MNKTLTILIRNLIKSCIILTQNAITFSPFKWRSCYGCYTSYLFT